MKTAVFSLCLIAGAVSAQSLPEDDAGPLTGGLGLPGIEEGGQVLSGGELRSSISLITASHAIVDERGDERLVQDGETMRAIINLAVGIGNGIELGAEIPYVAHQAGGLDSLIDHWHDIFNLPDGSRDERPQDLLEFSYADAGGGVLEFTDSERGLGDVRFYAGLDIDRSETHQRALRVSLKIPTGDADRLLGSGGYDMAVGFAGDMQRVGGNPRLAMFYRASLAHIGEPDVLANRVADYIGQLSGGLAYDLTDRYQLNLQSTLRSAAYDSQIEKLGEASWTLTFGGNIRLNSRTVLSLGVSEDIKVSSAPDVTFNIGLRYQP